ncbi:MAG: DEAD/DEAH box helicase [Gracilimonas sp.]|uniref:DEAD/DEAH box helicase n=2 Tax=Balneolaceae TaxID=1813606 RepID=UPI001B122E39|nr:DEAD/DEAH box helicase [Gracilimonas sp.]MBO6585191.1 DEAD/DEAH box helicase [Gracilimonas sp.]MBO6615537.1 DEAD/DEAH box helicase [Gracilimonas sp.]
MSFEEFGLSPELMSGLADVRIEKPTPLQTEVIPPALQGRHMLVKHEAGDDGVFLIPALQKLTSNGEVSGIRVLILTPSIERVKEIDEKVWAMGYHAQISSAALSMKGIRTAQEEAIKDGAPVVVANPGRLIEILDKNKLKLPKVDLVIIDEAHGMENYNLVNRVKDIMQLTEGEPQTLIFSESNNKATQQLSSAFLKDPVVHGFDESNVKEAASDSDSDSGQKSEAKEESKEQPSDQQEQEESEDFELDQEEVNRKLDEASVSVVLNPEENKEEEEKEDEQEAKADSDNEEEPTVPEDLTQAYIYVPPRAKISTLLAHLEDTLTDKIVVFAASKRTTDRLFRIIRKKGWGVVSINEGLKQEYYDERFGKFTSGDMKILLVGGLSATEIELNEVKQVINYDVPNEVEEYKYRAELVGNGKAARMVSLVSKMDKDDIDEIVKKVGYAPTEIPLPEEVKEKKGRSKKSDKKDKSSKKKSSNKNKKSKNDDRDRKRRKKPKEKKSANGLPRPSYDGLSGGKEGDSNGKRPSPSKSDGAFGWIKKLFN